jgi:hypothetical protein
MASREQLFACALANTPACVRLIRIREDLTGCAHPNPKSSNYGTLETPRPGSRPALQVFLHECAHYALDHRSNRPVYLEEYEAEVWSFARMREAGIPVPRESLKAAKRSVAAAIETALARGMKSIESKAARFAGCKRTPVLPFQIYQNRPQHFYLVREVARSCKASSEKVLLFGADATARMTSGRTPLGFGDWPTTPGHKKTWPVDHAHRRRVSPRRSLLSRPGIAVIRGQALPRFDKMLSSGQTCQPEQVYPPNGKTDGKCPVTCLNI